MVKKTPEKPWDEGGVGQLGQNLITQNPGISFLWADETLRVNKAYDWLQERKTHIQLLRNSRSK